MALPQNQPTINPAQVLDQPDIPILPNMPVATQENLVDAVNAIRQVVQQLGTPNTRPAQNNNTGYRSQQPKNQQNKKPDDKKKGKDPAIRFEETQRTTSKQRVYNPNDNTQYIEFEQIDKLELTDNITGAKWTWTR